MMGIFFQSFQCKEPQSSKMKCVLRILDLMKNQPKKKIKTNKKQQKYIKYKAYKKPIISSRTKIPGMISNFTDFDPLTSRFPLQDLHIF